MEFALIVNILALLLMAVWQFGITFVHYIEVTDAARATARKAATYGAGTAYNATVENTSRSQAIATGLGSSSTPGAAVTVEASPNWVAGADVRATVTAPYSISLIGFSLISGTLEHTVTMRIEHREPAP